MHVGVFKLMSGGRSSGGKEKSKPKKCVTCGGKGQVLTARQLGRGMMTQEMVVCSACKGIGQVYREKDRCKKCHGTCINEEKKVLEVYIPRGAKEDDKIVLEGEADEQPNMETGNIVFVLEEKEHEHFTRAGPDLTAPLKISLAETLTGFSRVVLKHLDGRGIQISHPAGKLLRPGQVLKIPGEGMPHKKGEGKGDLYLVVDVEFPEEGWTPDVEVLRKILPERKGEDVKGEPVDEVDFESDADLDDVSPTLYMSLVGYLTVR